MNLLIFALIGMLYYTESHAQNYRSSRCQNPNGRAGTCVSIYDCQTLLSVLQRVNVHPNDVSFVRASQCFDGIGSGPHVCCSGDTGFLRTIQPQSEYPSSSTRELFYPDATTNFYSWDSPSSDSRTTLLFPSDQFQPRPRPTGNADRESRLETGSLLPLPPACGGGTIQNRILGGKDADLYEFPWMVMFEYDRGSGLISTNCAGSLINRRYVLTAAHCVMGAIEKQVGKLVSLRLGEHDTSTSVDCSRSNKCAPEAIRVGFEQIIPHEQYKDSSRNKENDIALVRLDRNVRFSDTIRPICLPSALPSTNDPARSNSHYTVAGWGRTVNTASSVVKQKLNVPPVEDEECRRRFRSRKVKIVPSHICAGGTVREDSCEGDSGGPLMRFRNGYWVLEGIVSFGVKCGLKDWPAVHTRVASYDQWIRTKLRE